METYDDFIIGEFVNSYRNLPDSQVSNPNVFLGLLFPGRFSRLSQTQ